MKKFIEKYNLLIKIFFAVILGCLIGQLLPDMVVKIFISINVLIGKLMNFTIPLIIISFITKGITSLGKSSGKLLLTTVIITYSFMIMASCFTYFITTKAFPIILNNTPYNFHQIINQPNYTVDFVNNISLPPIIDVFSALIFAFVIGIGISMTDSRGLKHLCLEFYEIINLFIQQVIIKLLPLYVIGTFAKLSASGQFVNILITFSKLFVIIVLLHLTVLFFQFLIAGIIFKKNPFSLIKNILPAYFSALATQSSVAVIPVTMQCTKKNGVSDDVNNFVIPLCSTIHLTGSIISITSCTIAMMYVTGMPISFVNMIPFMLNIGILMAAAPGIPCGAILAATGALQTMLGFDSAMISMMITLHVMQDGFGTACNISGDIAVAMIIEKIHQTRKEKQS
ncbi:MAG: dicarboxylate/amino acid:cation symporter [Clostridia bacterium]|nr:dicarboxylate/amino acid:cation symporter [Clostridia bacterium]